MKWVNHMNGDVPIRYHKPLRTPQLMHYSAIPEWNQIEFCVSWFIFFLSFFRSLVPSSSRFFTFHFISFHYYFVGNCAEWTMCGKPELTHSIAGEAEEEEKKTSISISTKIIMLHTFRRLRIRTYVRTQSRCTNLAIMPRDGNESLWKVYSTRNVLRVVKFLRVRISRSLYRARTL